MDISFRVPYNQPGLISIVLDDYRYTGGAHGGDIRTAYTFDLETGRQLGLGDLMKEGSDYRSFINQRIRQEIDKMVQESGFSELATFEDIGDSPNFYLTDDAIVFFFQQYEYFPYAAGIPEFAIPYSDLDGMLNGDFLPPPGA